VRSRKLAVVALVVLGSTGLALSQDSDLNREAQDRGLSTYILGPGDEMEVIAVNADEISNRPIRIDSGGEINLPMVGRIRAAGKSLEELENEIEERLRVYIREPDLAITVTQFRSQPVSVLGSVGSPGVVQLEGQKTLLEVLSLAGGLSGNYGSRITITRRSEFGPIPLPSATAYDEDFTVAEVDVSSIMDASRPEQNIEILPYDVITVPKADVVYVMGDVSKPGGFTLEGQSSMSVLRALALSEGLKDSARGEDSRIIRPVPDSTPVEIAVNLKDLLEGKTSDMMLQPEDILFVPTSLARSTFRSIFDTAIRAVTSATIYRGF
jgi:polysaccharide export outer membrane protein